MTEKRSPARWGKAKWGEAGSRWGTSMNRRIWEREHGRDKELGRNGENIAVAYPDGRWRVFVGRGRTGARE